MERGADIHNKAEDYLKGKLTKLPVELKLFEGMFKELKKQYKKKISGMTVEDTWALTKDWARTTWNDWTGCWTRIKLDCAHHLDDETLIISDWKTGKFRPELNEEYMEQLELYALGALILHEHVKVVIPRLVYLDEGKMYPSGDEPKVYHRGNIAELKKTWEKRVKPMMNDTRFAPRPNDKCKWCHFSASKGGPCKF